MSKYADDNGESWASARYFADAPKRPVVVHRTEATMRELVRLGLLTEEQAAMYSQRHGEEP